MIISIDALPGMMKVDNSFDNSIVVDDDDDGHRFSQQQQQQQQEHNDQYEYVPIIACRRQKTGEEERFHEDPAVVDMAITFSDLNGLPIIPNNGDGNNNDYYADNIDDDDDDDDAILRRTEWSASEYYHQGATTTIDTSSGHNNFGDGISEGSDNNNKNESTTTCLIGLPRILLKHNKPLGFADMSFATRVLDRFPRKDYKGVPLPQEELPMFCYPTGCRLVRARYQDAPLAECYGFVVKNERGDSIHGKIVVIHYY